VIFNENGIQGLPALHGRFGGGGRGKDLAGVKAGNRK